LKLRPGNPQALNGLGILAFQEKRYDDAFGLFQAATALHPLDQDILMNLWECAQSLRREKEVLPKLKLSLERNPALEDIRAIVKEYA
jgi:tetratricopeptide (TPR) repeat protein